MTPDTLLRLATALTPVSIRARMAEEWAADLAGCAEVGIQRAAIVRGALRSALDARARRLRTVPPRLRRVASAALIGLLLGAVCAIGDIPVLTVIVVAAAFEAQALLVSRRRRVVAPLNQAA